MEPFQIEPSLDPDTQYLVPRFQTLELDDAIADINSQFEDLEVRKYIFIILSPAWLYPVMILVWLFDTLQEAFSWRTETGLSEEDLDMTPFSHPLLDSIDEKLREIEVIKSHLIYMFKMQHYLSYCIYTLYVN